MSCKVTCYYCTLTIIMVVIVYCLWLIKLIGIILIGNECQSLLWKNKKFLFCSLQMHANQRARSD